MTFLIGFPFRKRKEKALGKSLLILVRKFSDVNTNCIK